MTVIPYSSKYFSDSVDLFVDVYSDSNGTWSSAKAGEYLQRILNLGTEYCFVALEGDQYIGSVFSFLCPNYDTDLLFIDVVQVKSEFRRKGVASALLEKVLEKAKREKISSVNLWSDSSSEFPISWYTSLGFKTTKWVELDRVM
jgi:GNAT superfamily N-acetyltransferase